MSKVVTRIDQSSTAGICDTDDCVERVGDATTDFADYICIGT